MSWYKSKYLVRILIANCFQYLCRYLIWIDVFTYTHFPKNFGLYHMELYDNYKQVLQMLLISFCPFMYLTYKYFARCQEPCLINLVLFLNYDYNHYNPYSFMHIMEYQRNIIHIDFRKKWQTCFQYLRLSPMFHQYFISCEVPTVSYIPKIIKCTKS